MDPDVGDSNRVDESDRVGNRVDEMGFEAVDRLDAKDEIRAALGVGCNLSVVLDAPLPFFIAAHATRQIAPAAVDHPPEDLGAGLIAEVDEPFGEVDAGPAHLRIGRNDVVALGHSVAHVDPEAEIFCGPLDLGGRETVWVERDDLDGVEAQRSAVIQQRQVTLNEGLTKEHGVNSEDHWFSLSVTVIFFLALTFRPNNDLDLQKCIKNLQILIDSNR